MDIKEYKKKIRETINDPNNTLFASGEELLKEQLEEGKKKDWKRIIEQDISPKELCSKIGRGDSPNDWFDVEKDWEDYMKKEVEEND